MPILNDQTSAPANKVWTQTDVINIIREVANNWGFDSNVALAVAHTESGFDPYAFAPEDPPGSGGGSSAGLFQLHQGGELTGSGLNFAQAFDPWLNANVAISHMASVQHSTPGISSLWAAVIAQGGCAGVPCTQQGYYDVVEPLYNQYVSSGPPLSDQPEEPDTAASQAQAGESLSPLPQSYTDWLNNASVAPRNKSILDTIGAQPTPGAAGGTGATLDVAVAPHAAGAGAGGGTPAPSAQLDTGVPKALEGASTAAQICASLDILLNPNKLIGGVSVPWFIEIVPGIGQAAEEAASTANALERIASDVEAFIPRTLFALGFTVMFAIGANKVLGGIPGQVAGRTFRGVSQGLLVAGRGARLAGLTSSQRLSSAREQRLTAGQAFRQRYDVNREVSRRQREARSAELRGRAITLGQASLEERQTRGATNRYLGVITERRRRARERRLGAKQGYIDVGDRPEDIA